jgi:membrane protein implicated in regulation of membrane protease activity
VKPFSAIITGLALAALGYQVIEIWVTHRAFKGTPGGPVTGLEALVGSNAEVIEAFRRSGPDSPAFGRVRVGSESWQAELSTNTGRLAEVGDHVRIVGASGLLLKVVCS